MTRAEQYVDRVEARVAADIPIGEEELRRLVGMARRGLALAAALRGDPGHDVTEAMGVRPGEDRTPALRLWQAAGATLLRETGPFVPGECRVCACTATTACSVPTKAGSRACGWRAAIPARTLCDSPACLAGIEAEEVGAGSSVIIGVGSSGAGGVRSGRVSEEFKVGGAVEAAIEDTVEELADWVRFNSGVAERDEGLIRRAYFALVALRPDLIPAEDVPGDCYGSGCDEFPGLSASPRSR